MSGYAGHQPRRFGNAFVLFAAVVDVLLGVNDKQIRGVVTTVAGELSHLFQHNISATGSGGYGPGDGSGPGVQLDEGGEVADSNLGIQSTKQGVCL